MPATADIIPTDMTLEIGEDVSPERFMAATRAFFGYVHEIGRTLVPNGEPPAWTVLLREGSGLIAMNPVPGTAPEILQAVYSKSEKAIDHLMRGQVEESGLSEPVLKHLRGLSEITEGPRGRSIPVQIWVRRKPIPLNREIARVIKDDWRVDYSDHGTIEGRLETIQDKAGRLQLQIRDVLLREVVKCYFPEEMLENVFENFRKRVEIEGVIHYRRNGVPVSIKVEHIDPFPEDHELPTPEDVRGILKITP